MRQIEINPKRIDISIVVSHNPQTAFRSLEISKYKFNSAKTNFLRNSWLELFLWFISLLYVYNVENHHLPSPYLQTKNNYALTFDSE